MEKILEKSLDRYCLAGIDKMTGICWYVRYYNNNITLVDNIEQCTKYVERSTARTILNLYENSMHDTNIDLIIIPLTIEYYLIKEVQ